MLVLPRELQTPLSIHTFQLAGSVAFRAIGEITLKSFASNCALFARAIGDSREMKTIAG